MEEEKKKKQEVPLSEKLLLTVEEAAMYSGIGATRVKEMAKSPHCRFVLYNGKKRLIKRKAFEEFIDSCRVI